VLNPAVTKKIYGKRASDVFGFLLVYVGISNVLSSIMASYFLEEQGYPFFFFLGCGFSVISLIILFFFEEKKRFK